ncbi:MAG: nucleoside hydrolase [Chloroflexi bacterium]|nr:nucleoside hydrolase [Chloroflexota bacterium]
MTPRSVIIDTDTGIDDFFAIVQALRSPELDVATLTTVGGNVPLRYATRNALRAVEYAGRIEISVIPGAARPLRGRFHYAPYYHGPGGLPAPMPRPKVYRVLRDAVDFLHLRATGIRARKVPFTLIALGPATNVARLFRRLGETKGRNSLERVVIMGGAVDVSGNVTPFAEFNTWNDPEAAAEVFAGDIPVTLVPLDVCNQVRVSRSDFAGAEPTARRLGVAWLKRHPGRQLGLADCVAIAAVADPGAFRFERIPLEVDTSLGPERGRTNRSGSGNTIEVAVEIDADRVLRAIRERAFAPPPPGDPLQGSPSPGKARSRPSAAIQS